MVFSCAHNARAGKGKDKDANKGKSEATKSTGTIKGAVGTDPKSPRADNGGADDLSNAGQVETADDGVLTFVVGDTRLALTHKKLLNDQAFFDMELQLGGQHKKVCAFAPRFCCSLKIGARWPRRMCTALCCRCAARRC